ncbi:DUF421 domain-containing protein [Salinibacterium sp. G-O1]|uniref:DUF421 domain-containing protein n=1 Tax=Salinibacterium sp. G-O1 TaxID=3046208 RepID=UPI0024BBDADB|nr:YetF domain-containing protein [Salinibacterium sp. G-O1]MDJ0334398.1 DUF421 domain-containing protein [Salinibacterium sp. G-O1]
MWFDTWSEIVRVLLVGIASYAAIVVFIRVSGKRALAQLNAFDFVVTVALGSTLATILLSSDVSYAEGATALGLLLGLQVVVSFGSARWKRIRKLTTATPAVLLTDGQIDDDALKRARLSDGDVRQAVRRSGYGDLGAIAAVVLESNGELSVIPASELGTGSALPDVDHHPQSPGR